MVKHLAEDKSENFHSLNNFEELTQKSVKEALQISLEVIGFGCYTPLDVIMVKYIRLNSQMVLGMPV